ncbi:MAG: HlyD family efflux transporter periplasmic adaptor subunit [bacterium]|nr:HlyD family efflux transporter periplasmic adaptor subunit [bacterium]
MIQLTKNQLLIAGTLTVVALAFTWGLRTQPIAVDLATIEHGDLFVTVNEEGVSRIREIYTVSAPISGLVRRLSLKVGDRVQKAKTIVAVLEPIAPAFQDERSISVLRANVKSAQAALALSHAELSRVQADYDYAKADFQRTARLYKKRILSRKLYDKAAASKKMAQAAIDAAKANVEVRSKELESIEVKLIQPGKRKKKIQLKESCCLSILAPVTGRVLSLKHKSEKVVTAGTPLLEIGNDHELEIVVDLMSADAVKIKKGASATIDGWGGQQALMAVVRHIEPAGFTKVSALGIEEQRVKTVLDLVKTPEHAKRLGHDFRVFVHIKIWEGTDLLLTPLSALFRKGNDWVVFTVQDKRAVLKKIQIDHRNQDFAHVIKGLKKGDRVILHPSDNIKEGTLINDRALTQ